MGAIFEKKKKYHGNREGTGEIKERKLRHKHLKNFNIMGGN